LTSESFKLDKWYNIYDIAGENTDDFHDALKILIHKQPLIFIGLVFEYSDSHEDFRVKYFEPDIFYKYATELEIIEGLRVPQKYRIGDNVPFCIKCCTIRVFGKKCLSCGSIIQNKINTNDLDLSDYGRD
jgi:hypothetical protein